jgi:hypothetical protein
MSNKKGVEEESAAPAVAPLLVDIRFASRMLGVSVFAIRNLCWHRKLKPVRQGKKYLFAPASLTDLAAKLVSGEVTFPPVPPKKAKKAKQHEN